MSSLKTKAKQVASAVENASRSKKSKTQIEAKINNFYTTIKRRKKNNTDEYENVMTNLDKKINKERISLTSPPKEGYVYDRDLMRQYKNIKKEIDASKTKVNKVKQKISQ